MSPLTTWILGIFLFVLIILMISISANKFQEMINFPHDQNTKGPGSIHPNHMKPHHHNNNIGGDPRTWTPKEQPHLIGGDPRTWSPMK